MYWHKPATINPSRLHKLVAAIDAEGGKQFAQYMGTEDRLVSALSASIEGGKELRKRVTINLKLIPRATGRAASAPAPEGAVKKP